jgi:hypothetical protein
MNLKRLGTKRALVAGVAALAVVVGAGAAIAAGTDVFDPKAEHDAFQAAVAEELGVTTKQLQDAYKTAALDRLDAAVAAGRITKEQADAMRTRIQSGEFGPMGGMGGPGMHGPEMRGPHAGHLDAAATYLGLTEAQLREKLIAGQSLAEIAEAEGKSVDGLKAAMLADAKTKLDQAVKDGTITAAQRDEMLKGMESRLDDMINRTGPPMGGMHGGPGFGHGPGMHGGPGFGGGLQGPPDA